MRDHYLKQLQHTRDEILRMSSRVEHALHGSLEALKTWNSDLAQQVIAGDREINEAARQIEDNVLTLIATQQPVASDLRSLIAIIEIAHELERSGDYSKGIAKRVLRSLKEPTLIEVPSGIFRCGEIAQQMLHTSIDAFIKMDAELARSLGTIDEQVDEIEDQVVADLKAMARNNVALIDNVVNLIDVAHVLERMADRTTNIAERVIFIATNRVEDINP